MATDGAMEGQEPELEHLLDTIPDDPDEANAPEERAGGADDDAKDADGAEAPILMAPSVDVHGLISRMRRDVESAFQNELDRLEKAFAGYVDDLQQRIRYTDSELSRLASERERLAAENTDFQHRWRAIRDLTDNG